MRRWIAAVVVAIWARAAMAERLRAPDGSVKDVPEASVEFAIRDGYARMPKVMMRDRSGAVVLVDDDQAAQAEAESGLWRMTTSEVEGYRNSQRNRRFDAIVREVREESCGGARGVALAGLAGIARGGTLTISDRLLRLDDQTAIDLDCLSEINPWSSRVGVGLGVLLLAFLIARLIRRARRPPTAGDDWRRKLREIG